MQEEPFRSALAATWRVTEVEGVLARYVAGPALVRLVPEEELMHPARDDLNPLEFGFARGVHGAGSLDVEQIIATAAGIDAHRPAVDGASDWEAVEDERVAIATSQGVAPDPEDERTPARRALAAAQAAYLGGDRAQALAHWRTVGREPRNLTERVLVAEALADTGDPGAAAHAERLRVVTPVEAELVLARLALRQGRVDEAVRRLESAFTRHRTDPWPAPWVVRHGLQLARELARTHPARAGAMAAALRPPFALRILEDERREAVLSVAGVQGGGACVEAFGAYEPHVPWRGPFLERRLTCYAAAGHPAAARAAEELAAYREREPQLPFGP